jgi:hypothetical protein
MTLYTRIVHRNRWTAVLPHFDVRECPDCGACVHKQIGQNRHAMWHDEQRELQLELAKRTGITEEQFDAPWNWSAGVDGDDVDMAPIDAGSGDE